jgi:putative ABC transport system permease protein
MNLVENIQMAVRTLNAHKLRSLLTMLGIIIGNASVISIVAIGEGAKTALNDELEAQGPNQLLIFPGAGRFDGVELSDDAAEITLEDVDAIAQQAPSVKEVAPSISTQIQMTYGSRSRPVSVEGTTPGSLYVLNLQVDKGQFISTRDVQQNVQSIAIGPTLERQLFGNKSALGEMIQVGEFNFQVVGVMRSKGAAGGERFDESAYVPITTMATQLSGRRSPNGIPIDGLTVSAQDAESIRAAAFQISNILTNRHGKKDFSLMSNKALQEVLGRVATGLSLVFGAIAGISLLVGGIGVMNIMLVSVTERTQEIGLRKAIGATEKVILTQFLIEAILLCVAGGAIGIGIGTGSAFLIATFSPLKPTVSLGAVVVATGVSGTIGLVFGVVPARQAARLDPIVALRS